MRNCMVGRGCTGSPIVWWLHRKWWRHFLFVCQLYFPPSCSTQEVSFTFQLWSALHVYISGPWIQYLHVCFFPGLFLGALNITFIEIKHWQTLQSSNKNVNGVVMVCRDCLNFESTVGKPNQFKEPTCFLKKSIGNFILKSAVSILSNENVYQHRLPEFSGVVISIWNIIVLDPLMPWTVLRKNCYFVNHYYVGSDV